MLEKIRVYLMERWATKRKKVTTFKGNICPKVLDRLQLNHQGMKWRVKQHHYQHQKNHLSSLG